MTNKKMEKKKKKRTNKKNNNNCVAVVIFILGLQRVLHIAGSRRPQIQQRNKK